MSGYIKRILTKDGPKQIDYNALANLPKSTQTTSVISTLWVGSTAPYTQSMIINGVTEKSIIEISLPSDVNADQVEAYQALNLQDGGQDIDKITLRAFGEKNTIEIPINIVIRKDLE